MTVKKTYYLLLLFLLITLSKQLTAQELISHDTLCVDEPCLVYWQMTMPEYDSVFAEKTVKLDSLFYEFNLNIQNLSPYLSKKGIKSIRFDGKFIHFKSSTISVIHTRLKLCSLFGVILFDPQKQPLIIPGVNKNIYIMQKMKEYYGR